MNENYAVNLTLRRIRRREPKSDVKPDRGKRDRRRPKPWLEFASEGIKLLGRGVSEDLHGVGVEVFRSVLRARKCWSATAKDLAGRAAVRKRYGQATLQQVGVYSVQHKARLAHKR